MKKPLRKDYSGAGGAAIGSALAILIVWALRQFASIEMGVVEIGALTTIASAVVSLVASYVVPLSETEERMIVRRAVIVPTKGEGR